VQAVEVRRGDIRSRGGKQVPERRPRAARACGKRAFFLRAAAGNRVVEWGQLRKQVEWVSKGGQRAKTQCHAMRQASRTPMSIK